MRQPSITCQDNGARRLWGAPIPLAGTRLLVWMSDVAVVWVCVVHCVLGVDIMWLCVRSYGRFLILAYTNRVKASATCPALPPVCFFHIYIFVCHRTSRHRPRVPKRGSMVGNIRFLTLVKPVLHVLPEVAQPDRKIPFKVRLPA